MLPQTVTVQDKLKDSAVCFKDEQAKSKVKQYADVKWKAKDTVIQVRDTVLLCQKKENKFSNKFDPKPFKVTRKKGTMITALQNGKYVTRNASLFKKVCFRFSEEEEESDEDEDEFIDLHDRNENLSPSDENNGRNENTTRRYPMRNRKQLNRYGQNIYDS